MHGSCVPLDQYVIIAHFLEKEFSSLSIFLTSSTIYPPRKTKKETNFLVFFLCQKKLCSSSFGKFRCLPRIKKKRFPGTYYPQIISFCQETSFVPLTSFLFILQSFILAIKHSLYQIYIGPTIVWTFQFSLSKTTVKSPLFSSTRPSTVSYRVTVIWTMPSVVSFNISAGPASAQSNSPMILAIPWYIIPFSPILSLFSPTNPSRPSWNMVTVFGWSLWESPSTNRTTLEQSWRLSRYRARNTLFSSKASLWRGVESLVSVRKKAKTCLRSRGIEPAMICYRARLIALRHIERYGITLKLLLIPDLIGSRYSGWNLAWGKADRWKR